MNAATATGIKQLVDSLFEHMATGKIIDAMNTFYDDNVAMQENANEPCTGLAANIEREHQFLATIKDWKSLDIHAVAVNETAPGTGTALVEYSFDFINTDDQPVRYEQVAVQKWNNGKITHERFYYNAG